MTERQRDELRRAARALAEYPGERYEILKDLIHYFAVPRAADEQPVHVFLEALCAALADDEVLDFIPPPPPEAVP